MTTTKMQEDSEADLQVRADVVVLLDSIREKCDFAAWQIIATLPPPFHRLRAKLLLAHLRELDSRMTVLLKQVNDLPVV